MKCSVYIATSLDGFIAREDGSLDWLPGSDGNAETSEDYGYHPFISSVDALIMGRNSYEKILSFGGWHYGDLPVVVLSRQPDQISIPDHIPDTVEARSWKPAEVIEQLAQRGHTHLYIDGGVTIQRFLNAGLINELIITRIPTLIGRGIPLFGPTHQDIPLELIRAQSYPNGMVQLRYRLK